MSRSLRRTAEQKGKSPDAHSETVTDGNIDVNGLIGYYGSKSESELMRELEEITARQRAEGSFDEEGMRSGIQKIAPMLTDEQRRRLDDIIGKL